MENSHRRKLFLIFPIIQNVVWPVMSKYRQCWYVHKLFLVSISEDVKTGKSFSQFGLGGYAFMDFKRCCLGLMRSQRKPEEFRLLYNSLGVTVTCSTIICSRVHLCLVIKLVKQRFLREMSFKLFRNGLVNFLKASIRRQDLYDPKHLPASQMQTLFSPVG